MAVTFFRTMKWIGLIIIFVAALALRFWHFPSNPPSLNWDEVSFGYNAYSVLKTGRDEFGTYLPKYFRSLDDYKMPVYSYLTVASVGIFGLNDFAVRFPSAFFGLLTVALIFILVRELCQDMSPIKPTGLPKTGKIIAILSAALLAITPWHVQFSRMAAEANVGIFFLVAGVTGFLFSVRKNLWFLPLATLCFGFAIYSYRSLEVIGPIIGVMLVVLYWRQLFPAGKKMPIILSGILIFLVTVLVIQDVFASGVNLRIKGTSIFDTNDATVAFSQNSQERLSDTAAYQDTFSRLFHNNKLIYASIIARGYLVHFSPTFWFFDYDQKLHHTPFVGLLYVWMLFFMPIGAYFLIKKFSKKSSAIVFSWLAVSPIPASITRDIPHAIRVLPMLIPLVIITAAGIFAIYEAVYKHTVYRYVYVFVIFLFMLFSATHYFHQYDVHLPRERSQDWVYGRKQMIDYVEALKNKYKKVIVSTRLEWPHVFFLYYSKYDPTQYLAQGGTISGGWGEERNHYDKYEFRTFTAKDFSGADTLYVGLPKEFPGNISPLRIIQFEDGKPAIWIAE